MSATVQAMEAILSGFARMGRVSLACGLSPFVGDSDRVYCRGLVPAAVEVLPCTSSNHPALLVSFSVPD
jgi:endonuclease/exonuclease/phosphatase (EEP) superfamily protein YafD